MSAAERYGVEICTVDGTVDLDRSVVLAEVYSRAVTGEDEAFIGCYFLLHSMEAGQAQRAMDFFLQHPSVIVDVDALIEDSGAEFPALVRIRWTDETPRLLSAMHEYGILREIPSDDTVRADGLDLFLAVDAIGRGQEPVEAADLPPYDYRSLRRKVYALRAAVVQDRDPWLVRDLQQLREMTKDSPEGCEALVARADDMEAALRGGIDVGDGFSVVIPTTVQRSRPSGAVIDWIPQAGREIVVAHGLDAAQAARVLAAVRAEPEAYVSKGQILDGTRGRETLGQPIVIRDASLNWIATDLDGRRSSSGYERLRRIVRQPIAERGVDAPVVGQGRGASL